MSSRSEKKIGLILKNISEIIYNKESVKKIPNSNVFIE